MLNAEELVALRSALASDADRAALLATIRDRAAPVLARVPPMPQVKAMLTRDGGSCAEDGALLRFDPWSPDRHVCPRCGRDYSGERHHGHWARAQHLWLAERAADLALLGAMTEDRSAASRAVELLGRYETLYLELPNRDNVLGPSHLFFSTYLESMWVTSYLAAASLLREAGLLPPERADGVNAVADEAAHLIAEFDEGHSNRQTWHAAALSAIASWFGDEELAATAVESRTGLVGHLTDGFGADGLWWEGENYHLFAIRGLMLGMHWARGMGFELLEHEELRTQLRAALLAPARSALPDFTFPARRDSRYGVSLAQPAYLEVWEAGRAWIEDPELDAWLAALYALPAPPLEHYDAWLHEAGRPAPDRRDRTGLSWWAFLAMGPRAAEDVPPWKPCSTLLPVQGLAVLRSGEGGSRYASLECGAVVGGHGHPDRLHLTLHADGVHWLPDPGTGSYVVPSLRWYRSALAHNAPRIGGENTGGADAWCAAFACDEDWSWCRGQAEAVRRSVVLGPSHLVDVVELEASEERELDLPWHFEGDVRLEPDGPWQPAALEHEFVSRAERIGPNGDGTVRAIVTGAEGRTLTAHFQAPGAELVRAEVPGLPTAPGATRTMLLFRARAKTCRWVAVLDSAPAGSDAAVTAVEPTSSGVDVVTAAGRVRYRFDEAGVTVEDPRGTRTLGGVRPKPKRHKPLLEHKPLVHAEAYAPGVEDPPALDGTLEGFDTSMPLTLDSEHQYRRSEEPYDPDRIAAEAWVNRGEASLYLAVAVHKADPVFLEAGAAPQELDNEPDEINVDGIQAYARLGDRVKAVLVAPVRDGTLRVRIPEDAEAFSAVTGAWAPTDTGYLVTLSLEDEALRAQGHGARIGFDLLVNEMHPGRRRRAGQLVWSGGAGWVYLRGDRHDTTQMGILELG